ncbi:NitT/TauT family transport system ATP-binding protein [Shimia gijangensis]|uniref:NitT/TauT family transport system ATP-binding protein n=1 Tax=Shimia gijangensis TaxID=1470563 RepID=A0A1M6T706_9RHOB|nr:ABC transporter ATP-binding protein [Shimia gijangensis]SHK52690.1 NitT/TauT family transport system ATP-binding protein [Shimia gijangensis]
MSSLGHTFSGGVTALTDFSLDIAPGEFVSIVGPSGCGKTTVLNLVAGLLDVQSGDVKVGTTSPKAGRHDVAYMMARDCLYPWLNSQQNAEFGNMIRKSDKADSTKRVLELLERVGLKGFEKAYPKELSHGMRQRVALARTFAMASPVLLMDEPFGALDAQTKLVLAELLDQLWEQEHRTVLFITHDLAEAIALSDRVIVMSQRPGRIIANIPIELERPRSVRALQKDPHFHEIYANVWSLLEQALEDKPTEVA